MKRILLLIIIYSHIEDIWVLFKIFMLFRNNNEAVWLID